MDHLSSAIAILNRAAVQKQLSARMSNTKLVRSILFLLIKNGFIRGFNIIDAYQLTVFLKYDERNSSALRNIFRVSKPGRRVYTSYAKLHLPYNSINSSNTILVLSTSRGIMTSGEAKRNKIGGEVLLTIL